MLITVTADDIEHGLAEDCHKCPVARAISRAFPNQDVAVTTFWLTISDKRMRLPLEAGWFVIGFDRGYGVEPFSFEVNLD